MSIYRLLALSVIAVVFTACAQRPVPIQLGEHTHAQAYPGSFSDVPGWKEDDHAAAFEIFVETCGTRLRPAFLDDACNAAVGYRGEPRRFFEAYFMPAALTGESSVGLMTGYYEPLLFGSRERSERYCHPLYARPADLVRIDLGKLYPQLRGMKLRGRLEGDRVVPYASRSDINANDTFSAPVLCYVDDATDRFFLQVQGSGKVLLDSNDTINIGYADENGHPYESIGRVLIERGEVPREAMSLQAIRQWIAQNPRKARELFEANPSFVFFQERPHGATGSLGIELTPLRSLAVDRRYIPLGMPLFYAATDPLDSAALRHLGFAHDTGGAIKGEVRADLFFGNGKIAEARAGKMQSDLRMWLLLPRSFAETLFTETKQ